ncbi:hypothetical protein SAV31267_064830 [Streptomyces avermitilis]|uniref:Uncharacterized protein n=1 Tax=Streptomyces avermitilis TaxID=33903 RepID=A0A4D4MXU0_STRAX|nr:hypothetical protein SAV31267_064830 [Streptomyces avermitilis]
MGEEQLGSAPAAEEFVQVVGAWHTVVRLEPLVVLAVVEQPELPVVDEFVLLALLQRLDGEPELLLGLVHGLVVEVGHARVQAQHGLGDAQFVLARRGLVVHEGSGDVRLSGVACRKVDLLLAVLVGALLGDRAGLLEVVAQGLGALGDLVDVPAGQGEHGAGGDRACRVLPDGLRVDQRLLAEVRAVGEDSEYRVVAVRARAHLLDLAVREQKDLVGPAAERGEHLPRCELPLLAALGELAEHLLVLVRPQQRQFAELRGNDLHTVTGLHEGDTAVAHGVTEPAVYSVRATLHVHPRQHAQQPT